MNSRRFIGLPQDQGSPTEYSKVRTVHRSKSGPLMSEWVIQDRCGRSHASMYVRFCLPAQPVDATQALNFSAGVSNPRVLRGRSLSWRATLLRWACEYTDKSAPFGKYCLSRPLVFSLEPRCHGLCGSQK